MNAREAAFHHFETMHLDESRVDEFVQDTLKVQATPLMERVEIALKAIEGYVAKNVKNLQGIQ